MIIYYIQFKNKMKFIILFIFICCVSCNVCNKPIEDLYAQRNNTMLIYNNSQFDICVLHNQFNYNTSCWNRTITRSQEYFDYEISDNNLIIVNIEYDEDYICYNKSSIDPHVYFESYCNVKYQIIQRQITLMMLIAIALICHILLICFCEDITSKFVSLIIAISVLLINNYLFIDSIEYRELVKENL